FAIRLQSRRVEGGYVINWRRIFITNGRRPPWVVVLATIDSAMGRACQRAFVIVKWMEGFSYPHYVKKMSLCANEAEELLFEECFVLLENLLGGEALYEQTNSGQSGFSTAMKTFDSTRPIVASMATGIARAAYEYTLDIVKTEYPKQSRLLHQATDLLAE